MMLHARGQREYDVAAIVGPYTWSMIHHLVENFPCHHCAEEGGRLMRGLHDLVNLKLGKKLQYPADFRYLADAVCSRSCRPTRRGVHSGICRHCQVHVFRQPGWYCDGRTGLIKECHGCRVSPFLFLSWD